MSVRNYIGDAKTCKEFHGEWSPSRNKCDISFIKKTIEVGPNADHALKNLSSLIGGMGVESTRGRDWVSNYYQDINLLYVNKGDTYAPTIVYDTKKDIWYIGTSWGNIVESDIKRFEI